MAWAATVCLVIYHVYMVNDPPCTGDSPCKASTCRVKRGVRSRIRIPDSPRTLETMRCRIATVAIGLVLLAGCSEGDGPEPAVSPSDSSTDGSSTPAEPRSTETTEAPRAKAFDPAAVISDVRRLANRIGTREATSPGFRQAARFVKRRLAGLGYDIRRTEVRVPAGDSWGVPVEAGLSSNIVADPPGFDRSKPYRIIGAHLDSVAVSPGAEDNASGVSVMLDLARMAAEQPPRVPVRFVAFGAEEPRGESDDMHHFGSRQYVRRMPSAEQTNLAGMVSLDRVGVRASAVPICTAGPRGRDVQRALVRAARQARVPHTQCEDRASDHWSFEKAGLPAARLGSIPYAGYHSERDRPHFVDEREVRRVGRIMWRWISARPR